MLCLVHEYDKNNPVKCVKSTVNNENIKVKESRLQFRFLRKSRSSGNFGSSSTSSIPGTSQEQQNVFPGTSTETGCTDMLIQRAPSHSIFKKCDKASLKFLSTSSPAMTAQVQQLESSSFKATEEKALKAPTTSKARQKKFNRHFPSVDVEEKVLNHYSCALIGDILLQGHLYITNNNFAFYSNVFGYVTKLLIPVLSIKKITKEKTARIIPNAVGITTNDDKHVFGSLLSRDSTYRYMTKVWEGTLSASLRQKEIEIAEATATSDTDSTESKDNAPKLQQITQSVTEEHFLLQKEEISKYANPISKMALVFDKNFTKLTNIPTQSLLLFASTLLLILLFFSAAILLYRISKIQDKYSFVLQESFNSQDSNIFYSHLLQWQTHLHLKSAGAINDFLDSNLIQIVKIRKSLEALSTLLITNVQDKEKPFEES